MYETNQALPRYQTPPNASNGCACDIENMKDQEGSTSSIFKLSSSSSSPEPMASTSDSSNPFAAIGASCSLPTFKPALFSGFNVQFIANLPAFTSSATFSNVSLRYCSGCLSSALRALSDQ